MDGVPYKVVEYAQKQLGRGGSIVNTKLKNMVTGNVLDKTFRNDESVAPANITRQSVQYLYSDNSQIHLMDLDTFETIDIQKSTDPNIEKYILEGGNIDALIFENKIIGFEWPKNVILKVTSTPGGDKGNSASSTTKQAKLETGISVAVPQFIKNGEKIKVDTRSGTYIERAK